MNTWTITNLERAQDDYITIVHWRCDGSMENPNDAENVLTAGAYGTVAFTQEEGEEIIPFTELTEELVKGWMFEKLNKEEIEAAVQDKLNFMANPPLIDGLPW